MKPRPGYSEYAAPAVVVLRRDVTALAAEADRLRAQVARYRLALGRIGSWNCESPRLIALDALGLLENH